jgi:hypothetical protein
MTKSRPAEAGSLNNYDIATSVDDILGKAKKTFADSKVEILFSKAFGESPIVGTITRRSSGHLVYSGQVRTWAVVPCWGPSPRRKHGVIEVRALLISAMMWTFLGCSPSSQHSASEGASASVGERDALQGENQEALIMKAVLEDLFSKEDNRSIITAYGARDGALCVLAENSPVAWPEACIPIVDNFSIRMSKISRGLLSPDKDAVPCIALSDCPISEIKQPVGNGIWPQCLWVRAG